MENMENKFASNLTALRKERGLTQSQLAEKFNYTDKTISKWENGDALPDSQTLFALSQFFGVSMDSLFNGEPFKEKEEKAKGDNKKRWNKLTITLLALSVVWFVAVFAYVQLKIIFGLEYWLAFIWAVPASMIVLVVFNSVWGRVSLNYLIVSVFIWSLLGSLHLQVLEFGINIWPIYFLGIPLQIATLLWSQLKSKKARKEKRRDEKMFYFKTKEKN